MRKALEAFGAFDIKNPKGEIDKLVHIALRTNKQVGKVYVHPKVYIRLQEHINTYLPAAPGFNVMIFRGIPIIPDYLTCQAITPVYVKK